MHVYAVRARLVVGCVLLSAVAGCGGDPPTPPPFTPATSSTSATPTGPVEPVLPEAAQEPTEAGAKAFAEFYWEMATYAQKSGNTNGIRDLGAETCGPCVGGAEGIERVYDSGGVILGGEYTARVTTAKATSTQRTIAFRVVLSVHTNGQTVDYPGTKRDRTSPAATNRISMIFNFLNGDWTTATWEVL